MRSLAGQEPGDVALVQPGVPRDLRLALISSSPHPEALSRQEIRKILLPVRVVVGLEDCLHLSSPFACWKQTDRIGQGPRPSLIGTLCPRYAIVNQALAVPRIRCY